MGTDSCQHCGWYCLVLVACPALCSRWQRRTAPVSGRLRCTLPGLYLVLPEVRTKHALDHLSSQLLELRHLHLTNSLSSNEEFGSCPLCLLRADPDCRDLVSRGAGPKTTKPPIRNGLSPENFELVLAVP